MKQCTRACIISLIAATLCTLSCRTHTQFNVPANITFLSGSVYLNGKLATLKQAVHYGDIIETKERSRCRVVIDSKNVIGIQSNTTFVYNVKHGDGLLELKRGYIGAVIKNRKNIKNFRIKTRTVTAAVRGTSLFVGVENPETTYTCVCNGRIHFTQQGEKKSTSIAAPHHRATYYVLEGNRIITRPGTLKYHDDASVENLASSIGVTIDWTKIPE